LSHIEDQLAGLEQINRELHDINDRYGLNLNISKPKPPEPTERPLPDDGTPLDVINFDGRSSNVCSVPPDVKPDWLNLAVEAAQLLRDRASDPKLAAMGKRTADQLLRGDFRTGSPSFSRR